LENQVGVREAAAVKHYWLTLRSASTELQGT